jgi:hypothetical protein
MESNMARKIPIHLHHRRPEHLDVQRRIFQGRLVCWRVSPKFGWRKIVDVDLGRVHFESCARKLKMWNFIHKWAIFHVYVRLP